jgi:ribosomal protein L40E
MVREAMRHRTKQGLAFLVTMVGLFLALDGGMYLYANWRMQQVADAYATCRRSPNYQLCSVFYPDLIANTQKEIANLRTTLTIGLFGLMLWVMFKNHFFVGKNEEPVASWKQPQPRSAATVELKQEPKMSQKIDNKRSGKGVNKGAILASALIIGVSIVCLAFEFTPSVPQAVIYTTSTAATVTHYVASSYVGYTSTSTYTTYTSCSKSYYYSVCRTSTDSYAFPVWMTTSVAREYPATSVYKSTSITTVPPYTTNTNSPALVLSFLVVAGGALLALGAMARSSQPKTIKLEPLEIATERPGTARVPQKSEPMKFCRECGAKIPRDSVYCEECGAKLA